MHRGGRVALVLGVVAGFGVTAGLPGQAWAASAADLCRGAFGSGAVAANAPTHDASPGEHVSRDISWDSDADKPAPVEVLGCTTVNGSLVDRLSFNARFVVNDGHFAHQFTIPARAAAGARICERGAVIRPLPGGSQDIERLDAECYSVPGAPGARTAAAIPPEADAAPAVNPLPAGESPVARSAAAVTPGASAPSTALPRTGSGDRSAAAVAGLLLTLGGLAVGTGRSTTDPVR